MGPFQFDANAHTPQAPPVALPKGQYPAVLVSSEKKENSKKTGHYLQLKFKFIIPPFNDRTIKSFLNVSNPEQTTVDIAFSQLSAICHSTGVLAPMVQDNGAIPELYGKPLLLSVKIDSDDYNQITGYSVCDPSLVSGIAEFGSAPAIPTMPTSAAPAVPAVPATTEAPKFDPNTGQPLAPPVVEQQPKFDSNTGQPIVPAKTMADLKNPTAVGQAAATVKGPWD